MLQSLPPPLTLHQTTQSIAQLEQLQAEPSSSLIDYLQT